MKIFLKIVGALLALLIILALMAGGWYIYKKQPVRSGLVALSGLKGPVSVQYDERGVPHIRAENETDMVRALGYVHAQDRLFQMEMVRRVAQGELAEILGPGLLEVDKLFRTLGIRAYARNKAAAMDMGTPSNQALLAYLDGINQYQDSHKAPMEFDILRIPKRPFTVEDSIAVTGYLAYTFAAAFTTEPVMTYIRDKLGPQYLRVFDIDWHPEGVITLSGKDWEGLNHIASVSREALEAAGVPQFMGSNAWAIAGKRTPVASPCWRATRTSISRHRRFGTRPT